MFRLAIVALVCVSGAAAEQRLSLDVPFVRQTKNGCGPSAVSMLMQYWLREAPQAGTDPDTASYETIDRELAPAETAALASSLAGYLQRNGFRVFAIEGRWEDLREQIEKGRPLIAAVRPGSAKLAHFVVVAGVEPDAVLIHDPGRREMMRVSRGDWEREWQAARKWLLVAVPDVKP